MVNLVEWEVSMSAVRVVISSAFTIVVLVLLTRNDTSGESTFCVLFSKILGSGLGLGFMLRV